MSETITSARSGNWICRESACRNSIRSLNPFAVAKLPSELNNFVQIDRIYPAGARTARDQGKKARSATEVHDNVTRPYCSLDRLHVRTYPDGIGDHGSIVIE